MLQPTEESTTRRIAPASLKPSTRGETAVIPRELSDELQENLQREGLTSAQLLNASANKLMRLMEESVTESDLQKSAEGVMRVEPHKIQQSIDCANAIAGLLQTQVNIVKAMSQLKQRGG